MKPLLYRPTPLSRVMNPHPTSASNSSEMPFLISVRVFLFSKSRILTLHVIVVIRYIFDRDQKLSPGALTMLKAGFKVSVGDILHVLTCFCHGYRVQWYRTPPLLLSVCGPDYMNFFCLNPRNFQLAYRGMPLNSRTGKNRSMYWRSRRDVPPDNTGLILSHRRYRSIFSFSLNLEVLLRL